MKGGIGWNLIISGVEHDLLDIYLMLLSQEIDIKNCKVYQFLETDRNIK